MASYTTFYFSRILDKKVFDPQKKLVGTIKELFVNPDMKVARPEVFAAAVKTEGGLRYYDWSHFIVLKRNKNIRVKCLDPVPVPIDPEKCIQLKENFLDKQIVDINGRKLVRVNDLRLISIKGKTFVLAVDIGVEGLFRRIGIARPVHYIYSLFNKRIPAKFILWEDVEAIDFARNNITLSKNSSRLDALHPGDIADLIEEMGKRSVVDVFSSLDEEKAADVLEELEPETQIQILENLPEGKIADVLDKMPADEVAALLDGISEEKAERILNEMDSDSKEEVRGLLEYPERTVGGIMTTDFYSFDENHTVENILDELRIKKPEPGELYNLFVVDERERLLGTFSLRDLVVSAPSLTVNEIMQTSPVHLNHRQSKEDIANLISKYNMLAIPVVDNNNVLVGMVVIDDVMEELLEK